MTRRERVLKYISQRPVGRDEGDIFHQLSEKSFTEMRLFLQNLMTQGLLDSYDRLVEGRRLATIWQITPKGQLEVPTGEDDHAVQKQSASCNRN